MLRSSISPTISQGGYRVNVIPSEAKATLDTRLEPTEDAEAFLESVREVINDPAVDVAWTPRNIRFIAAEGIVDDDQRVVGLLIEGREGVQPDAPIGFVHLRRLRVLTGLAFLRLGPASGSIDLCVARILCCFEGGQLRVAVDEILQLFIHNIGLIESRLAGFVTGLKPSSERSKAPCS